MVKVFERPKIYQHKRTPFCPGCGYGIITRCIVQVVEEMRLKRDAVLVEGGGCYRRLPMFFDLDNIDALHGRAPSVATGVKRMLPESFVFCVQGDGDMLCEGLNELFHVAGRGENITCILFNNGSIGETGGQMAQTTILGQPTTTTPKGRDLAVHGPPFPTSDLLAKLPGVAYVARASVHDPENVLLAKQCFQKAFEAQLERRGFSFVEVISICPSQRRLPPVEARAWTMEHILKSYPNFFLGELKNEENTMQDRIPAEPS